MINIYLTGFMGTGKTSSGRLLADRLRWTFVDIDLSIEEREGISIPQIFSRRGEPAFRALEKGMLSEIAASRRQVVSCGGGIVLDPENIRLMRQTGRIVCLTALPAVILERTRAYKHRPLLNVPDPVRRIETLLAERAGCYAQADLTVETSSLSEKEVAEIIATSELLKAERPDGPPQAGSPAAEA